MKLNKPKRKIVIPIISVVVVIAILLAIVLPMYIRPKQKNESYISNEQSYVIYKDAFDIKINEEKGAQFNIDPKTSAVVLISPSGNEIFNGFSIDAAKYSLAEVLNVRLRDKNGNSYIMNSTDNSAKFGTFEVVKQNKSQASVIFNMFPDEASAKKGNAKSDLFAVVTVVFGLKNGKLNVSVDTTDVVLPKGYLLEKLSILPGLFSNTSDFAGSTYTIPDGSGAEIALDEVTEKALSADLEVYGADASLYQYNQGAMLPFFAYKQKGCLVNTFIDGGDALSEISFKKLPEGGGYLYNTFTVTDCGVSEGKFIMGESYEGELSQTYYVNEKNNDYNEIALNVRDALLTKGYLPKDSSKCFNEYPFFISVLGSSNGKTALTTFEDAAEISTLLESRGVKKIALRFMGGGKKGLNSVNNSNFIFSDTLGGKEAYKKLASVIVGQKNMLYFDVNPVFSNKELNRNIKPYDFYTKFIEADSTLRGVNTLSKVKENIAQAYKLTINSSAKNLCLNDISYILYSDLKTVDRQTVLNDFKNNVDALSINGDLMFDSAAVYLLGQGGSIFNVPNKTVVLQEDKCLKSVPILQIVLHGSVVYGSQPLNLINGNIQDSLLKFIEYGAVPTFLFTHRGEDNLNYEAFATETAQLYSKVKKLEPTLNMKISSHEEVVPGVFKITYDYSRVVYVNYNPSVVEVNGIMISPKDFVII